MKRVSVDHANKPENPQKGANWLSILTFWYTVKLFRHGRKRDFDEADITNPLDEHKSEVVGVKLAILWQKELKRSIKHKSDPNFTKVLYKCFRKEIFLNGLALAAMELLVRLYQPLFLGLLLRYFSAEDNEQRTTEEKAPMYLMRLFYYYTPNQTRINKGEAYLYASGIVLTSFINVAVVHPCMMSIMHLGMKLRVACCSLIYRKTLRLDLVCVSGPTAGNVVNLISNDVTRFDLALLFIHYLWIAPVQMFCCLYFMYREVAISAVIGFLAVLGCVPLQAWFGNMTSIFRLKTAMRTDERVRQMNEIIQGIQVIKMYAWEYAFAELIHRLRRSEITVIKYTSYIRGMIMSFIMFVTRAAIFFTVLSYVVRGKQITAEKVFVITSYYQILRQTMTLFFPSAIAQVAESNVSISRIKRFLMMPETTVGDPTPYNPLWESDPDTTSKPNLAQPGSVHIVNASAKFADVVCLNHVTLDMKPGQLTAVIGQVGSGKSCLLNLIMGEIVPFVGSIKVSGMISYAAQEPWLFVGTVRQNILFGREYNRPRYQQVVRACALVRDFSLLPFGDQTMVGERGISLSGGQRARINLARAVYKEADVYLLDDPLSAVDTQVGKQLFQQCVTGYLANKIVVLVTHQLQFLSDVNQVVLMHEGSIAGKGTYDSLKGNTDIGFSEFMRDQLPVAALDREQSGYKIQKIMTQISLMHVMSKNVIDADNLKDKEKFQGEEAEMRTHGSVGCYVYKEYFLAGGHFGSIMCLVLLFILAQGFASATDYFLSVWVNVEEKEDNANIPPSEYLPFWGDIGTRNSLIVYSSLIMLVIIVALWRSFVFFSFCMRASVNLHDRMFDSICTASMNFFNQNSSGRILNRFSKDLGAIDEFLPNAMMDCTQIILNLVGAIAIIGLVNPILLAPTLVVCASFFFLRQVYLHASRSIKRLEGIERSPVFSHMNATLQGLATIRSNGAGMILTNEFDAYQDNHSSAWFMFIAVSRAFGLWLDLLCTVFIALVTYSFLIFGRTGSDVGLAVTQTIGLSGLFQWGVKQSAELENQMTSVERVLEFLIVDHEPPLHSEHGKNPPPTWPKEGNVEFQKLVMRYSEGGEPVLKSLTFRIQPREKVGIVGRTGAGKSSLIAALFRLAPFEGKVVIDGVDTSQIGLHDLRKKISIIPQEPVLFSGTLRYNMDPFSEYKDEEIVDALTVVEIKAALTEREACLDHIVAEGGVNISVGERQMVCLARAILRNNVILVLDEATANVDPQTDKFIQTTIRKKFEHCTVLTIAHRLHTVMDSDKVLVMDAGTVVEFDHPHNLLLKNGYLSRMVEFTGAAMSKNLKEIAKNSFDTRRKK